MKRKKNYGQKKQVLVYHLGNDEEKLLDVLQKLSISVKVLEPAELSESIGYLCGMYGFTPAGLPPAGENPKKPLMVFSGITRAELDRILSACFQAGIAAPALKAMVTETNKHWSVLQLLIEIEKEHQLMQALKALKKRRQAVDLSAQPDDALLRAAAHADVLLNGMKKPTLEEVLQTDKQLSEAVQ